MYRVTHDVTERENQLPPTLMVLGNLYGHLRLRGVVIDFPYFNIEALSSYLKSLFCAMN